MTQNKAPFAWFVLAVASVLLVTSVFAVVLIYQHGTTDRDPGWTYNFEGDDCFVSEVKPDGPAAGRIQPGDRIVTINGSFEFTGLNFEYGRFVRIPSGNYDIRIARNSLEYEYTLSFIPAGSAAKVIPIILTLASSLISGMVALLIGYARPNQKIPRLFSVTWFSIAFVQLAFSLHRMETILSPAEYRFTYWLWLLTLQPISVATGYHGYYLFPLGQEDSRFWSGIKKVLYASTAVFIVIYAAIRIWLVADTDAALQWAFGHESFVWMLNHFNASLMASGIIAICAVTARNYRRVRLPDQKRRLQWLVYGSIIGVIPTGLYFTGRVFSYDKRQLEALNYLSLIFLSVIPIVLSFAIVKHRLFDIRVVVRRGLQYLLAKNFLSFLIYLPAALLVYVILANPNQSVATLFLDNFWFLGFMITAVLLLRRRKELLRWLDRKFFRGAYNAEQILLSMIDEVKNLTSLSEVSRWVSDQLQAALHPQSVLLFYRSPDKGDLALGYSSGQRLIGFHIPESSILVKLAESEFRSRDYTFFHKHKIPPQEMEWLLQEKIHLIVPMHSPDEKLIGLLMLGEKKSEEPYTANDRKLLEALTGQIAMFYENLLLKEKVHREVRLKEEVLAQFREEKKNLVKECPACGACYDSTENVCASDRRRLEHVMPVERTVDGKYQLEKLIGRGGMGAVYKAIDLRLNRPVAVKIIIGSMFGDAMALRRFEREARTSAKLNHRNIITVYDFGTIGQGAYIVMEYIEGQTLRRYLQQNGNVSPDIAANWFDQILDGMSAAHAAGIVHRDLKPENILIAGSDETKAIVKILDFGLAKVRMNDSMESKSLTSPGSILGTINYMSPEQIVGGALDQRSDIFTIGILAVEALTGEQPFSGNTPTEVAMNIIHKDFDLPAAGKASAQLNAVLQKCLAKDKKKRFTTVLEMHEKLVVAIRRSPAFAPPVPGEFRRQISSAETDFQV